MSTKTTRSTRVNPPCLVDCHEGMNTRNEEEEEEEVSTQPSLKTNAELFMGNLLLLFDTPALSFVL